MIRANQPAAALRHLIRYYYQAEDRLASLTALQPVPARSLQIIEFMFGTAYRVRRLEHGVEQDVFPIALVGAKTFRNVELLLRDRVDAFTIAFQPGGLATLFSIPAIELTNHDVDGEMALGRNIAELYARLGSVSAFADRVRVANEFFLARRPPSDHVSAMVLAAFHVLRNKGCVRVDDLAYASALGMRQFERRFRRELGMGPKLYSRVVRFEAALKQKQLSPHLHWTEIAHSLGYHDQMHMVHDFTSLSGETPASIYEKLDMFVKPEITIGTTSLARPGTFDS